MSRSRSVPATLLVAGALALLARGAEAAGNDRKVAFGLQRTCTGCHGLPPVSLCDPLIDTTNEVRENYLGGGGSHPVHVSFLRAKYTIATGTYDERLCTACHGANPGGGPSGHPGSPGNITTTNWTGQGRNVYVDIANGTGSWGSGRYNGNALPATGGEPQTCSNLNCHGPGAPRWALDVTAADPFNASLSPVTGLLSWDQMCVNGASTNQAQKDAGQTNACAGCHGSRGTAANPDDATTVIVVGPYTGTPGSQGVTASYYRPASGYSRGGHGDANIQQEDPAPGSFGRPDATGTTPLRCTACHNDALAHFPAPGGNPYRLITPVIENQLHDTNSVCGVCHSGNDYPGGVSEKHHPSYYGQVGGSGGTQKFILATTSMLGTKLIGTLPPAGYRASPGHVDFFVDFWGGNAGNGNQTTPTPAPGPVLPLERYVSGMAAADRVLCVTCHNPHGTDLFTYTGVQLGTTVLTEIPDNNMLRLRETDNTLCAACHGN